MRSRFLALLVTILTASSPVSIPPALATTAEATQLVMMESSACEWCDRWLSEIGPIYPSTKEGRIAPLRRVDVHAPMPADIKFLNRANFTPTFILVRSGREIGRIQGYPGENFFWPLLNDLLAKLKPVGLVEADAAR